MARISVVENATNMNAGATYSGGSLPTSGTGNSLAWDRGRQTMTSTNALAAVNLNRVEINSLAAPIVEDLEVDVTNGTSPVMLLKGAAGGLVSYKGDATRIALTGGMDLTINGGTTATLYVKGPRGRPVKITAAADVQNLIIDGAAVEAEEHATQEFDTVTIINGGRLDTKRDVKAGKVSRGEITFRDGAKIDDGSGTGTLELDDEKAICRILSTAAVTFDSINVVSGFVDPEGSGGDVTFTNATISEGARIRERYSGGKVVYTNTPTYLGAELIGSPGLGM